MSQVSTPITRSIHRENLRGSGIDRVVQAAEVYQLPAPDFHVRGGRTTACIFGPRPFTEMDRGDRIRATYQHSTLRWVMRERMTNTTLRERFGLSESESATATPGCIHASITKPA